MSEILEMDAPGFTKRDMMAYLKDPEPSKNPTTATDKLYKAEYEYRELLVLANAAKHRFKKDHEALHTETRFGNVKVLLIRRSCAGKGRFGWNA